MPAEPEALLDLETVRIDASLALRVPESLALRRRVLLVGQDASGVHAAIADPGDHAALEALERIVGTRVVPIRAEPRSLERAIGRLFHRADEARGDEAVRLADDLLRSALLEQASDIHLEPNADGLRIRLRIDGELEVGRLVPAAQVPTLMNRFKVMAGMDISERRLPQDGRFTHRWGSPGHELSVDVRAAVLPTKFGERMTLRLLASQAETLTLPRLGMADADLAAFRRAIAAPHGLVLLTGPTGSGKTTTLYAALRELDLDAQNVLTIEDPIEYDVPGVSQVEVESGDRVTFSRALRGALRHDPDVLMIGEIRDLETADVAVKASLTGHLVFSTLHTNSAASAVTRLVDMGIPPYLVAATLRLAVAQRLVRRLCARCRAPRPITAVEARSLGIESWESAVVHEPKGCVYCKRTGYAGRVGLFERIAVDGDAAAAIAEGASEARWAALPADGRRTRLREDAAAKVLSGVTSVDEALRAVEVA